MHCRVELEFRNKTLLSLRGVFTAFDSIYEFILFVTIALLGRHVGRI